MFALLKFSVSRKYSACKKVMSDPLVILIRVKASSFTASVQQLLKREEEEKCLCNVKISLKYRALRWQVYSMKDHLVGRGARKFYITPPAAFGFIEYDTLLKRFVCANKMMIGEKTLCENLCITHKIDETASDLNLNVQWFSFWW